MRFPNDRPSIGEASFRKHLRDLADVLGGAARLPTGTV
jgi:hypothetical protein